MLMSCALIILVGLSVGWACKKIHLPSIVGVLFAGILFGPYGLNILEEPILLISGDIRKIALVIILVKAGLSLNIDDLKRIGRPALLLCFVPALFEIAAFVVFAPKLMGVTLLQAGILGAVMGAVSPAVIIPRLTSYIDEGWGVKKGIPQMLIAGSSADDVFVIVIFSSLVSLEAGGQFSAMSFLEIPIAIISGILVGAVMGVLLGLFFKKYHMRDTVKVLIILALGFLLYAIEQKLDGTVAFSGLLAVMAMCIMLRHKLIKTATRLTQRYTKMWVCAELFLFFLVGASVNINYALHAGLGMIAMLFIGLFFRLIGTWVSILGTDLNRNERIFCLLSELPKATVQAAIGGVPLAMGLGCGDVVLTMAVVAIVISAPIGAFAMDLTYQKYLEKN